MDNIGIFKSFKLVSKMMHDRGYDVPLYDTHIDSADFTHHYFINDYIPYISSIYNDNVDNNDPQSQLFQFLKESDRRESIADKVSNIYDHPNGSRCLVLYFPEGSLTGKSKAALYRDIYIKMNCTTGLLICSVGLTNPAKKMLGDLEYVLYQIDDLQYDPTKNILSSPCRLLSLDESNQFLEENKFGANGIPKICIDGPLAKYYGGLPGQIFEFVQIEINPLTDMSLFYRIISKNTIYKN